MVVGPNVTGILDQNTFIETLGYVGLLYLMFQGGLDLDIDGFIKRRRESIVFGVLTFVLPMVLVTGSPRPGHRPAAASIIIGVGVHEPHAAELPDDRAVRPDANPGGHRDPRRDPARAPSAALLVLAVAAAGERGDSSGGFWAVFRPGWSATWPDAGRGATRHPLVLHRPRPGPAGPADLPAVGHGGRGRRGAVIGIEPIVGAFLAGSRSTGSCRRAPSSPNGSGCSARACSSRRS
jgi:hypothetical protein